MASYLVSLFKNTNKEDMRIAFYSGLLHDIAHPVSSFEGTMKTLQESFEKLNITKSYETYSIIDKEVLKDLINTVAFFVSIPKVKEKVIPVPWNKLSALFDMINKELFYEIIICSMNYEHSFLSAAAVFYATIFNIIKEKKITFYEAVDQLIAAKLNDYNDLFQIIQCIALHDRKASTDYKGLLKTRQITELNTDEFFLPIITIMADEIQEWGRPISADERSLVDDCIIVYDENENIIIKYACTFDKEILKDIEYCFLEHFFSKIRIFSLLKNNNKTFNLELEININEGLEILTNVNNSANINFIRSERDILWPLYINWCNNIDEDGNKYVVTYIAYPSKKEKFISSLIIYESDDREIIDKIKKIINNTQNIVKIILSGKSCELNISNGFIIKGDFINYQFTSMKNNSIFHIPKNYKILENNGIIFLKNIIINKINNNENINIYNLHHIPKPHFLDLDWRFNYKSINSILKFIYENIDKKGKVCYLGCPSLALYHNKYTNETNIDFTLFDKGHYALNKWLENKYIEEKKYVRYDVYNKIPDEYLHKYDIVIMDPPWYKEIYELFLNRAVALVKKNGIIGFAEYPGYPGKKDKINEFKNIREKLLGHSCKFSLYCSIEIAYFEPEFEKSWSGHKEFVHSAIGTYRPAYMDFYLINNPLFIKNINSTSHTYLYDSNFIKNIDYENGYMKIKNNYNDYFNNEYTCRLKTRKILKRLKNESDNDSSWIGWTTNNTIVFFEKRNNGEKIYSIKELIDYVINYEKDKAK